MKKIARLPLCLLVLALLLPTPLWAAAGKVVIAAGDVFAVNAQNQRRLLQRRSDVFAGDTLVTGANSNLQLRFEDNAILALSADSQLRINEYQTGQSGRVSLDLLAGGFRTISDDAGQTARNTYQVRTPNGNLRIRSTHYEVVFQADTLSVGVYEGSLSVTNKLGAINLGLDSDFLYAQVQAGALPLGLLDPPSNLRRPNTQQAQASNASDRETKAEDDLPDLTEENNHSPSSNNPDNTILPIPDADAISDGDSDWRSIAAPSTNCKNLTLAGSVFSSQIKTPVKAWANS